MTDLSKDLECEEYFGYNFKLNQFSIKFRKAKITPKKIGQFVTLWKRNPETKEIEPFEDKDNFGFYIIAAESQNKRGFFFFSQNVLIQNKILTTSAKEGKRGFRVYPDWDIIKNKQAEKTKNWQTKSFINFSEINYIEKSKGILNSVV
ncbi:hypothetical protein ACM39_06425 [Chryseobacterium sp. FH2]|uniref:MepB family protein n=1 Tax=Chryseobacterium sp. FH2 TaxID=1674291 RepID=UPI00065B04C7|nr:MepB family protein [Chryseobacterium sp. FH2]KMQ68917.1 hypothetical protein ACM39_06425 [Chryseobacterium sp. FH2]